MKLVYIRPFENIDGFFRSFGSNSTIFGKHVPGGMVATCFPMTTHTKGYFKLVHIASEDAVFISVSCTI